MKRPLSLLVLFVFMGVLCANEPSWTEKEREDNRDIVVTAEVTSVNKLRNIDKFNDLYETKLKIYTVHKGDSIKSDDSITVYYEYSISSKRRPAFADLKKGDKGKFFLRTCNEAIRKMLKLEEKETGYFLEMNSDVIKEITEQDATHSKD